MSESKKENSGEGGSRTNQSTNDLGSGSGSGSESKQSSVSTTSVSSTASRASRVSEDSVAFSLPQHDHWPVLLKNKLAKVMAQTSPVKTSPLKTAPVKSGNSRGKSSSTFKSGKSKR